jgi:hypothetical protein
MWSSKSDIHVWHCSRCFAYGHKEGGMLALSCSRPTTLDNSSFVPDVKTDLIMYKYTFQFAATQRGKGVSCPDCLDFPSSRVPECGRVKPVHAHCDYDKLPQLRISALSGALIWTRQTDEHNIRSRIPLKKTSRNPRVQ